MKLALILLLIALGLPFIPESATPTILYTISLSVLAYLLTASIVPIIKTYTLRANLKGKDLNKPNLQETNFIPECLGLASGIVFIATVSVSQLLFADNMKLRADYNAALHSISLMMLLGFADDVLDIPWRYKILLPFLAALPLVVAYSGGTAILLPTRFFHSPILQLGFLYQIYMVLVAVFCTNSINILAGVNGLEAGQSAVIAVAIIVHNLIEVISNDASSSQFQAHLFSLLLMFPFLGSTLGLLKWNWYPSEVFVGDTFTLYSGMTMAVAGILGHFSKTLMLFFLPQLLNFVYSLPQLIGLIPCPRHRLPRFDPSDGRLHGVKSHWNLVNLILLILGPMGERELCICLLSFQGICCVSALVVRYWISQYFYT